MPRPWQRSSGKALESPRTSSDRPGPTPAGSLAVTDLNAGAGAIITASHNPAEWNGFKVKSSAGGSAPPEMVDAIEDHLARILSAGQRAPSGDTPGAITEFDPISPYVDRLAELVDADALRSAGLKVVVDAMHGAGAGVLPRVLAGGSTEVVEIRAEPNPAFPGMGQPEPVGSNLTQLAHAIREHGADVGLALDGDADRLGVVDENGVYLSTLEVFSLIADHLMGRKRSRSGGVACTITMSSMVDRLGEKYGAPIYRTPVGFKYVGPAMVDNGCAVGGEESGGYAFRGHIPERDGPLSGLMFLEAIVQTGKTPSHLLGELQEIAGPHMFRRIDLEFHAQRGAESQGCLGQHPTRPPLAMPPRRVGRPAGTGSSTTSQAAHGPLRAYPGPNRWSVSTPKRRTNASLGQPSCVTYARCWPCSDTPTCPELGC